MAHTRDLKLAKLLQHTIGEYFVKHAPEIDIFIDSVEMSDRRNAEIFYRLGHNTSMTESSIAELHALIIARRPQLKKYIADHMQPKSIPKLHFHVHLHD